MWPLFVRTFALRGVKWVVFPLSLVIGLAGTQLETVLQKEKNIRDNTDYPSALERRDARLLQELQKKRESS
jgi:hypothetical protein